MRLAMLLCFFLAVPITDAQVAVPGEPEVRVQLSTISATGGMVGWTGGTDRFVIGEAFTTHLASGDLSTGNPSICTAAAYSNKTVDDLLTEYAHVWQVRITPLDYSAGRETMRVEWARFEKGIAIRPAFGGRLELTLDEGERHVLDLLHGDPATNGCNASAALLELGAAFKEDPAYADVMLKYELWLVHTTSTGATVTRQFMTMAQQGSTSRYGFTPVRFELPALAGSDRAFDVSMSVRGTLTGRLRADGRVTLELDTARSDGLGARGAAPSARGGRGEGQKTIDVGLGETIEIRIPPGSGWAGAAARRGQGLSGGGRASRPPSRDERPTQPVTVVNGSVRVNYPLFFKGHSTSLILKVTRVE
jgi:hypothetical protein